jgi:hypothetical protein
VRFNNVLGNDTAAFTLDVLCECIYMCCVSICAYVRFVCY